MQKKLDSIRVLGIIGLAKNTGKTTTLNAIIDLYPNLVLGLTSIGLDGEALDQVNFLPKPKIYVKPGMIVATTEECLETAEVEYRIIEKTKLQTALGNVLIVEIITQGHLIVAGPTSNKDLQVILEKVKKITDKVLIDGAFNRMTFANIKTIDGIVLASGASYHPVMEKTITKTKQIIKCFQFVKTTLFKDKPKAAFVVKTRAQTVEIKEKKFEIFKQLVDTFKTEIEAFYIKGALTNRMVDLLMQAKIENITLVCDDPTKPLLSDSQFLYLEKLNIKVEVIHPAELLFVTINPFSPSGQHYDQDLMLTKMKDAVAVPVYNVKLRS